MPKLKGFNFRLLAHEEGTEITFIVHEVYYNKKGEPDSYAEGAAIVLGDDPWQAFMCNLAFMEAFAPDAPIYWAGYKFPNEYGEVAI